MEALIAGLSAAYAAENLPAIGGLLAQLAAAHQAETKERARRERMADLHEHLAAMHAAGYRASAVYPEDAREDSASASQVFCDRCHHRGLIYHPLRHPGRRLYAPVYSCPSCGHWYEG